MSVHFSLKIVADHPQDEGNFAAGCKCYLLASPPQCGKLSFTFFGFTSLESAFHVVESGCGVHALVSGLQAILGVDKELAKEIGD
jgi:hypothetical protein